MSNTFDFGIRYARHGSAKQKEVGIYGTFSMTLDIPEGILCSFNDMKLMKSREGKFYIQSAFRKYDKPDENGKMVSRRVEYCKFFPEEKNWPKQDIIVQKVLAELEKQDPNAGNASDNYSKPKTEASKASSSDSGGMPW